MKRREFIKLSALATAGTATLSGCGVGQQKIESRVYRPENNPIDEELWYNTACTECASGCGVMVRVIDGRAKKVEGNPEHPVSGGKLCPRGQISLQTLYHPDRVREPQRRSADKGSNTFERIDWEEAIRVAAQRLNEAGGAVLVFTGQADGHTGLVIDRFARALGGGGRIVVDALPQAALRRANQDTFGVDALAEYDLDHADFVLSFGGHFIEAGPSPVRYGRGYGEMRQGRPGRRARMVQVEPRMSLTAANADLWLPINPGTEGAFALGVLNVIAGDAQARPEGAPNLQAWQGVLGQFTPENVSAITGVPADRIEAVARDFASSQAALAIPGSALAGYKNAVSIATAVNALNVAANNVGKEGGVRFAPSLPFGEGLQTNAVSHADLVGHIDRMRSGQVRAVVIYDANPAYTLPAAMGFADALAQVPFVLAFSSFLDHTTQFADLVLPDHTVFERWDTRVPSGATNQAVLTTAQPVVEPMYNTRATNEVVLALAREMGGNVAGQLPWHSFQDLLREAAGQVQQANSGSVRAGSAEDALTQMLQKGGWWSDGDAPRATVDQGAVQGRLRYEEPQFEGDANEFPFHLQVFESSAFGQGRTAALPYAQEMPDPMTTVVWGSWLEINPQTAREMGIREGDLLDVTSPSGTLQVPAYIYPGIAPNMVAMPLGQGHVGLGQWASGRGANPLSILVPTTDSQAGTFAYGATRVKIAKAAGRGRLVTIEGRSERLPGRAFFEGAE